MVESGLPDRLLVVLHSLSETCIQWICILWFAFLDVDVDVDIVNGVDANVDADANIDVDADVTFATKWCTFTF